MFVCVFFLYFESYKLTHIHTKTTTFVSKSEKNNGAYSTRCSQAVTHPSTNRARRCLTSVIGRELVCSTWYGRRHWYELISNHMLNLKSRIEIIFTSQVSNPPPLVQTLVYHSLFFFLLLDTNDASIQEYSLTETTKICICLINTDLQFSRHFSRDWLNGKKCAESAHFLFVTAKKRCCHRTIQNAQTAPKMMRKDVKFILLSRNWRLETTSPIITDLSKRDYYTLWCLIGQLIVKYQFSLLCFYSWS